jgi:hypothetical protein
MSTKIDRYKLLLTRITIAQNVQFHTEAVEGVKPFVTNLSQITLAFNAYKADKGKLNEEFNTQTKSIETDELAAEDHLRDAIASQLISRVDYHAKFPANDEEKDAIHTLKFVTDTYKQAPRKNYQAETSYIRNMVRDLNERVGLTLFGLAPLVNRLETVNNDFEKRYLARTGEQEAKRERGTLTELVTKTNASFDVLCQIVSAMSLMPLEAAAKYAVDQIISFLNGQIHQYAVVYHRHEGVIASKKKDDAPEDGGEEATEE